MTPEQAKQVYRAGRAMGLSAARVLTPYWLAKDFATLRTIAESNRMDPSDLLAVLASESHTLEPSARNPESLSKWPIAVGLNQLTRVAAAQLGMIPQEKTPGDGSNLDEWKTFADKVVKMTVAEQLPLVDAFYQQSAWTKAGKRWNDGAKIYGYVVASGTVNRDIADTTVIYEKGSEGYAGNPGLDTNGDGKITGRDLRNTVEFHFGTPLYQAAWFRMFLPELRLAYQAGWTDANGRLPMDVAKIYASSNPPAYRAAYEDGYETAARLPASASFQLPTYLA